MLMRSFCRSLIVFVTGGIASLFGQVTLIGPTYVTPELPQLAPGQVVTLAFTGLKSRFPEPLRATGSPLPTTIGGISITIRQFAGAPELAVPLLSISQTDCVDNAAPQCSV